MHPARGIDRDSAVPFYHQLKQLIVKDIAARGLEPGDRLPGDFQLCERYGVSRTVVRQALQGLEREGAVVREKGRGTFVADRKSSEGFGHAMIGLFEEDVRGRNGEQTIAVRRLETVPANAAVAADLRVPLGADIVEVERLRMVNGEPWALTVTQLPLFVGKFLLGEDLSDVSLYGLLERKYGVRFATGRRSIEASPATEAMAEALGIRPGAALLVLRTLAFDEDGVPLERFAGFHRGDLSRFMVDVHRQDSTD
ncbi:GntR family transcriptional regulator [Streptomyces sp. NBC_01476]|uniref:GntR family transcriptional regulator n=1 Tax=Streptomyces sp. NBC_01476 TaxID=2903881 RepID=UPI002E34D495|nr:GntR family transcriptional regulator [Streptomyces sp. NBC_01476]